MQQAKQYPEAGQPVYDQPTDAQQVQYYDQLQQQQQQQQYQQQQQMQHQQQQQKQNFPYHANGKLDPTMILCSQCKKQGLTRIKESSVNMVSLAWCIFAGLFCCLIPGCCKSQTEVKHYCPSCGSPAGKKSAECC